jgi:hypothetical protein
MAAVVQQNVAVVTVFHLQNKLARLSCWVNKLGSKTIGYLDLDFWGSKAI